MKLNRKKIIAREFLILISCTLVFPLAFVGTILYNHIIDPKISVFEENEKQRELERSINTLTESFSEKIENQKWFFNESKKLNATGRYKSYSQLWERLERLQKTDSIQYKWKNTWDSKTKEILRQIGFSDGQEFDQFIKSNSISPAEIAIKSKAESLSSELNKINDRIIRADKYFNKRFDSDEQTEFALACLAIIGILAFPVRYLFYAIRWSIRTLKQRE